MGDNSCGVLIIYNNVHNAANFGRKPWTTKQRTASLLRNKHFDLCFFLKKLYKEMVVIRNICAIFFGKNPNAMS
jgi:hypothetical protein